MEVFHQTGFRENWNIDIFNKENVGDGLILSPVNIAKDKITAFGSTIKENSIFDPQLYVVDKSLRGKLTTYDYHPQNLSTSSINTKIINDNSDIIAERCLKFQVENKFKYLVIPSQKYEGLNYVDNLFKLKLNYVEPFFKYIMKNNIQKPVYLSLIVSKDILLNSDKMDYMLNWVTGFQKLKGVYLIFENDFETKQIQDSDFLLNALKFINILKQNELDVLVGYCNVEGLLYSIAMPNAITMGSYENLRSFSISRYLSKEQSAMRPPKPRLFSNKLLNWINYGVIESIRSLGNNKPDQYFDDNKYRTDVFVEEFNWHFAKPELYKHYFISLTKLVKELPEEQNARIEFINELVINAKFEYNSLAKNGIILGDSDGLHLDAWQKAIAKFKKYLSEENL